MDDTRASRKSAQPLVTYSEAKRALAAATQIDDVKDIRDKAEALRLYAQQQHDTEMERMVSEIKLRAVRRIGQLSKELDASKGGSNPKATLPTAGKSKSEALADAGISTSSAHRAEELAEIPEAEFETFLQAKAEAGKPVTYQDAITAIKREHRKAEVAAAVEQNIRQPSGLYNCIVIDPPWPMQKIERYVAPDQVGFDYPTMSVAEIAALTMPAADDCWLFLWTTQKFLADAFGILAGWGFRYLVTMVWHKPGGFQPFGLPQYNCEFALIAKRGTISFADTKNFKLCQSWPRREHSRKPDEFYDLVRRVTPGKRIDIFSRESRVGFDQYGNETNKFCGHAAGEQ